MILASLPWKYRSNKTRLPEPCPQVAASLQDTEMDPLPRCELIWIISISSVTCHWLKMKLSRTLQGLLRDKHSHTPTLFLEEFQSPWPLSGSKSKFNQKMRKKKQIVKYKYITLSYCKLFAVVYTDWKIKKKESVLYYAMKVSQQVFSVRWLGYKNYPQMVQTLCCSVGQEETLNRAIFSYHLKKIFWSTKKKTESSEIDWVTTVKHVLIPWPFWHSIRFCETSSKHTSGKEEHNTIQISKPVMCYWGEKSLNTLKNVFLILSFAFTLEIENVI